MENLPNARPSLTPERWGRLKDLFEEALQIDVSERPRFIASVRASDSTLGAELDALLDYKSAGSQFDRPLVSAVRLFEYFEAGLRVFQPGNLVSGRFRIDRFIGEGGMGEVYAAEDAELGGQVALKTLRPAISSRPEVIAQFKQEIHLARKVTHPNVCRIFDIFRHDDGIVFLTMELLEGETLAERLRRQGPMKTREALPIVEQIVMALSAAHAAGIMHRDFKSGNVMLVPDGPRLRAVVTDFGLAREQSANRGPDGRNAESAIAGTPEYMAPEQLRNLPLTTAVDIYALGVVLFEVVTGCLPFERATSLEAALRSFENPAPSARQFVAGLDSRWESAIAACLDREPARRPKSAPDVLSRLRPRRWVSRRKFIASLPVLGSAGIIWLSLRPRPLEPEAVASFKRGEEFAKRRTAEALNNAVQEYTKAVRLEPRYGVAWAGLADASSAMANFNFMPPQLALAQARNAAQRAVEIDPKLAKAQGVLGYVTSIDLQHWLEAEPFFQKAVAADPHEPTVRYWYGAYLGKLGRFQEAIAQIRAGLQEAPSSLPLNQQLAAEYYRDRRFGEFYDQARELVRLQPFEAASHLMLARALEWRGEYDAALRSCDQGGAYGNPQAALCLRGTIEATRGNVAEARRIGNDVERYWRDKPFETMLLVSLYARIGDPAKVFELLNAGYDRRDSTVLMAPTNPYLDSLRDDPRYRAFLQRLGIKPGQIAGS